MARPLHLTDAFVVRICRRRSSSSQPISRSRTSKSSRFVHFLARLSRRLMIGSGLAVVSQRARLDSISVALVDCDSNVCDPQPPGRWSLAWAFLENNHELLNEVGDLSSLASQMSLCFLSRWMGSMVVPHRRMARRSSCRRSRTVATISPERWRAVQLTESLGCLLTGWQGGRWRSTCTSAARRRLSPWRHSTSPPPGAFLGSLDCSSACSLPLGPRVAFHVDHPPLGSVFLRVQSGRCCHLPSCFCGCPCSRLDAHDDLGLTCWHCFCRHAVEAKRAKKGQKEAKDQKELKELTVQVWAQSLFSLPARLTSRVLSTCADPPTGSHDRCGAYPFACYPCRSSADRLTCSFLMCRSVVLQPLPFRVLEASVRVRSEQNYDTPASQVGTSALPRGALRVRQPIPSAWVSPRLFSALSRPCLSRSVPGLLGLDCLPSAS